MSTGQSTPDLAQRIRRSLKSGDGLALIAPDGELDWREVAGRVRCIDESLSAAGVGSGAVVAVPGRNDLASAVAVLALVASGRCAAIVNPFRPARAVLDAARALGPSAIIAPERSALAETATPSDPVLIMSDGGALMSKSHLSPPGSAGRRRTGILISTSGTTGDPKPCHLARPVLSRAMPEIEAINAGFGDRPLASGGWAPLIQYSPLAHIGGALTLLRAAAQGRPSAMLAKFDAEEWAQIVEQWRPFTTGLPPSMMRMVTRAGIRPSRLASLVSIWSGTAPLRSDDRDIFIETYGLPVLGNYGATEFCGAIAAWSLADHALYFQSRPQAVGRINPAVAQFRIRSIDGALVDQANATGVLEFKVRRMGDRWIKTNDLGAIDAEGFLTLHGRKDDHIVRGGFKLSTKSIVDVLRQHPSVRDAAVVGVEDARLGQVPVAAVELEEGAAVEPCDLQDFVRARLPSYFVPAQVRAIDQLPRNAAMKLDRRAIGNLFKASSEKG